MPRRLALRRETLTELSSIDLLAVHGAADTVNGCVTGSPTRCGTWCDLVRNITTAQPATVAGVC
jgi:hypothetical protein